MRIFENKIVSEKYYYEELDNGLKVILMPKKDFYKTYAIFSTKYGSIDIEFIPLGEKKYITTPEGIAHFLEHKLFEMENSADVANDFAKLGSSVNAFTTSSNTSYLFSTVENVYENLELLIDFVQTPYFVKEGIDKERGIIEQELLMYLDNPQNVLYFEILKCLYKNNRIRNEIGGTVESIKEIDQDVLYKCYNSFYHPSNMALVVVGNIDPVETLEFIKKNQSKKKFAKFNNPTSKYFIENETINLKHNETTMNVNIPKVAVGLKLPVFDLDNKEFLKHMVAIELLTQIYFDDSSKEYEELMETNVINNSFGFDTYLEDTYQHILFTLDTINPQEFINKLEEIINKIKNETTDKNDFIRFKRYYQTLNLKRLDSLEYVANFMSEYAHRNLTYFDLIDAVDNIEIKDLDQCRKYFDTNNVASFVINPIERKKEEI